jgi:thiol-disulfide isomerase/thioredoxin
MTKLEEFLSDITSQPLVVVDVYRQDCEPCQRFMKIFDRAKSTLAQHGAVLVKYDIADVFDIKQMYDIKKVPCFLYFRNGQLVTRCEGIQSIAEMTAVITTLKENTNAY